MRVALSTLSSLEFNLIYCYCHFVNQTGKIRRDGAMEIGERIKTDCVTRRE